MSGCGGVRNGGGGDIIAIPSGLIGSESFNDRDARARFLVIDEDYKGGNRGPYSGANEDGDIKPPLPPPIKKEKEPESEGNGGYEPGTSSEQSEKQQSSRQDMLLNTLESLINTNQRLADAVLTGSGAANDRREMMRERAERAAMGARLRIGEDNAARNAEKRRRIERARNVEEATLAFSHITEEELAALERLEYRDRQYQAALNNNPYCMFAELVADFINSRDKTIFIQGSITQSIQRYRSLSDVDGASLQRLARLAREILPRKDNIYYIKKEPEAAAEAISQDGSAAAAAITVERNTGADAMETTLRAERIWKELVKELDAMREREKVFSALRLLRYYQTAETIFRSGSNGDAAEDYRSIITVTLRERVADVIRFAQTFRSRNVFSGGYGGRGNAARYRQYAASSGGASGGMLSPQQYIRYERSRVVLARACAYNINHSKLGATYIPKTNLAEDKILAMYNASVRALARFSNEEVLANQYDPAADTSYFGSISGGTAAESYSAALFARTNPQKVPGAMSFQKGGISQLQTNRTPPPLNP